MKEPTILTETPPNPMARSEESLSVFFPAFNDAESLRVLIPRAVEVVSCLARDYEIIVVDDGSTDQTAQCVKEMQQRFPRLRLIQHPRNLGYGAALRSGFLSATKSLVFYTDGDGQYDVGELRDLYARLEADVGLVNGYKIKRGDPLHRVLLGKIYQSLAKRLFGLKIRDVDCDFRLIRRSVVENLALTCCSGAICVELMAQIKRAGIRVVEVPVHHHPRLSGRSQFFRFGPVARMATDLLGVWMRLAVFRREPAGLAHRSSE